MFGSTGKNLCGSVLVVNRCLWIGACGSTSFNHSGLMLGSLLVTVNGERVLDGRERERERERDFQIVKRES